jgi:magnesium-transporting ATPase (P-type)
MPHNAITTA